MASGKDGAYPLGISALGRHGRHARLLGHDWRGDNAKVKKTADADGNPLEAHIASGIKGLSVTSVTNLAGDEILADGGEVAVAAYDLITITLTATGSDGAAPVNGSVDQPLSRQRLHRRRRRAASPRRPTTPVR